MSAGSALRATCHDLRSRGATVVAAGALLMLGTKGSDYFAEIEVPVHAVCRDAYDLWEPADCPMCAAGKPLDER
jgi:orotate phosphoribosyltransferase